MVTSSLTLSLRRFRSLSLSVHGYRSSAIGRSWSMIGRSWSMIGRSVGLGLWSLGSLGSLRSLRSPGCLSFSVHGYRSGTVGGSRSWSVVGGSRGVIGRSSNVSLCFGSFRSLDLRCLRSLRSFSLSVHSYRMSPVGGSSDRCVIHGSSGRSSPITSNTRSGSISSSMSSMAPVAALSHVHIANR